PFEKENALDQAISVLHLVDRFLVFDLGELVEPPVPEHAGMQEILIDGRQLELQRLVQIFDDLGVALHRTGLSLSRGKVVSAAHGAGVKLNLGCALPPKGSVGSL